MKALIDILKEEKTSVERIDYYDRSSGDFFTYAETKRAGYDPESCIRLGEKYLQLADEERKHLKKIRKALADHIADLMKYREE